MDALLGTGTQPTWIKLMKLQMHPQSPPISSDHHPLQDHPTLHLLITVHHLLLLQSCSTLHQTRLFLNRRPSSFLLTKDSDFVIFLPGESISSTVLSLIISRCRRRCSLDTVLESYSATIWFTLSRSRVCFTYRCWL